MKSSLAIAVGENVAATIATIWRTMLPENVAATISRTILPTVDVRPGSF